MLHSLSLALSNIYACGEYINESPHLYTHIYIYIYEIGIYSPLYKEAKKLTFISNRIEKNKFRIIIY